MKYINLKSGYSIIEIIIYIAVFATVAVVVGNIFMALISSFNQTRTNHNILQNGNTVLERMSREIHKANNIRTATSTFGSSPGVLDLDSIDESNNPRTVKFNVGNGALNLYYNNTLVGNLLSPNIKVISLIFYKTTTTNGPSIKMEITLQDTNDKTGLTEKFYNVATLSK
ncbi:hypothetical protein IT400_00610 [Candidatus Nomurabacteria bacterium]|nr:hypothetical protein [Candidatus Nomurabacteria bacterium]